MRKISFYQCVDFLSWIVQSMNYLKERVPVVLCVGNYLKESVPMVVCV